MAIMLLQREIAGRKYSAFLAPHPLANNIKFSCFTTLVRELLFHTPRNSSQLFKAFLSYMKNCVGIT